MVVLQVCAFAAPAPGNFISSLVVLEKTLKQDGTETIYAFPEKAKKREWCIEIANRTKVYFLPEAKARIKPATYKTFKKIYKENHVQIIHSHFELYDVPATITAPKDAKVFWHLHDALKENYNKSPLSRKILTKLQYGVLNNKTTLLSASTEHALFAEKLGFPKNKIYYIPNGINTSKFNITDIDSNNKKEYILFFGWDVQRKGVDVLVEAAREIDKEIKIVVVGQEKCEEYLKENKASQNIECIMPVKDTNSLYKHALAFLHISRAEGFSYALLEALYVGLPIICSEIPENSFAHEFKNVIWVPSGNAKALTKALNLLTSNKFVVKTEDIEFNRNIIRNKYSIDGWVKTIKNNYLK